MNEAFKQLKTYLDEAMAVQTALVLFEWDDATLAPKAAGENTSRVIEILSGQYFKAMTGDETKALVRQCLQDPSGLNEVELAQVKEMEEQIGQLDCIPKEEYQAFAKLSSESVRIWEEAKEQNDFKRFAPTLKKVVEYQKKFASYRAKEGQSKYDALLKDYEKGFTTTDLDEFFGLLKEELVPFLKEVMEKGRQICDDFLTGTFPEEKQEEKGAKTAPGIFLKVSAGSAANIKPELVLDAYYKSLGQERAEFAFLIQREDVYAAEYDEEGNVHFVSLDELGEEIE